MTATNNSPAQEASRQHDERLRLMVEAVHDYAIFMLDLDGRIVSWNRGAERLKGYAAHEAIGQSFSIFFSPEERERGHPQHELQLAREHGSHSEEGWRYRKDGTRFWASAALTLLVDERGKPYGYGKVTRDLTDRRAAEESTRRLAEVRAEREAIEKLQAATESFASAMTAAGVAKSVFERVLPVLGADTGSLTVRTLGTDRFELAWAWGHEPGALDKIQASGIGPEDDLPHNVAVRTLEPLFVESAETIAQRWPALAARRLHAVASLPLVINGECIGTIGFGYRAQKTFSETDRAVAKAFSTQCALALDRARMFEREQHAKERAQFLSAAGAIFAGTLDRDRILAELARLAVPRLGDWCTVDLVEGERTRLVAVMHADPKKVELARAFRERWPPDPKGPGLFQVVRTGQPLLMADIPRFEPVPGAANEERTRVLASLGMRSGLCVPLIAHGRAMGALSLVWAETPRRYSTVDVELISDLCARAALAMENARLYEDVRRAVEIREDFLSVAGHELRTPLAALSLNLQSAQRLVGREPGLKAYPKLVSSLEKTYRNYQRLAGLAEELLDVSRLSFTGLKLDPEPLELSSLVEGVVHRFTEEAANLRTPLSWKSGGRLDGQWDRLRLEQVVGNLLGNAIKYGNGQPVEVETAREGDFALLRVKDRGIGISPEAQARIFERFERAVSGNQYGGLGLGLWIARQAVEASGGSISVHSAPEQGSVFEVRLPLPKV